MHEALYGDLLARRARGRAVSRSGLHLDCWLVIVLLVLSTSCVTYKSKPFSAVESATTLEARALSDAGLRRFIERSLGSPPETWPLASWDFAKLTLAAFYFHPSLEVARAQSHLARATVQSAGGRPNPTLTLTPGYDFSAANGLSPWLPFLSVDVPVETAGKRGHRIARAQHLSEAARLNIATAAWQVRSNVRASLLDFANAKGLVVLLDRQLEVQEQIVNLLEQRVAAGALSEAEISAARIGLTKTRIDSAGAKAKRVDARTRLTASLGLGAGALEGVEVVFNFSEHATESLTSPEARGLALKGRSDILGALAEYAAAEAGLRLEIAKQFPDLRLSPGYQYDQGDNKWTLGISFELPVLNQNQGPIAEAEARREEVAARFIELQAKVIAEIDGASAAYRLAQEEEAAVDSLLRAEQLRLQSAEAQFQAGAADGLDLLTARLELGTGAIAQLEAQARLQQALGALEAALQRPLEKKSAASCAAPARDTGRGEPKLSASREPLADNR